MQEEDGLKPQLASSWTNPWEYHPLQLPQILLLTEKLTELEGKLKVESLQKEVLTITFMNDKANLEAKIA